VFLYPGTNDDHGKIFTIKKWALGSESNQMFSLEKRGKLLILRGIGQIKEAFLRIGIETRWKPIVGEDPRYIWW
jgi:hypothetical protein